MRQLTILHPEVLVKVLIYEIFQSSLFKTKNEPLVLFSDQEVVFNRAGLPTVWQNWEPRLYKEPVLLTLCTTWL